MNRLAVQWGLASEALVQEAVERMVSYDEWFVAEVEVGLKQIEQGQTSSHEEVGTRIHAYLATKQQNA